LPSTSKRLPPNFATERAFKAHSTLPELAIQSSFNNFLNLPLETALRECWKYRKLTKGSIDKKEKANKRQETSN
jgi:hypothetical protein